MPFPGPRRKGLCGAVTFLGRGLASSPSPCRGAEARGQGGGDSQWTSVPAHKEPLWPSSWLPYSGPRSPTRLAPRSLVRHGPCGSEQAVLPSQAPSLGVEVKFTPVPATSARACSA